MRRVCVKVVGLRERLLYHLFKLATHSVLKIQLLQWSCFSVGFIASTTLVFFKDGIILQQQRFIAAEVGPEGPDQVNVSPLK